MAKLVPVKITELQQICRECPSQWEGKTEHGWAIYIRYRHGELQCGVASSLHDAIEFRESIPGDWGDGNGFIELAEVAAALPRIDFEAVMGS